MKYRPKPAVKLPQSIQEACCVKNNQQKRESLPFTEFEKLLTARFRRSKPTHWRQLTGRAKFPPTLPDGSRSSCRCGSPGVGIVHPPPARIPSPCHAGE